MLRLGKLTPANAERAVETIYRNAKSQAQLVADLLDVSRIISGKLRLDVRPVDLISIINAAIDSIRPAADAKTIRLQATLDPAACSISGDAEVHAQRWSHTSQAPTCRFSRRHHCE
jgi:signal transduction histidine kinase